VLGAELEVFGEREEAAARDTLHHGAERVEAGYEPWRVMSRGAFGAVGGGAGNSDSGEDPGVDVVVALFVNHQVEVAPLALFDLEVGAVRGAFSVKSPHGVVDENLRLRLPPVERFCLERMKHYCAHEYLQFLAFGVCAGKCSNN
jgi:hypothetical protein